MLRIISIIIFDVPLRQDKFLSGLGDGRYEFVYFFRQWIDGIFLSRCFLYLPFVFRQRAEQFAQRKAAVEG